MNPPLLPVFSYTAVYAETHASMQKASRVLFFHAVIVNQTSFQDDLALFIGQLTEGYGKRLQAVCIYHISCNFCSLFLYRLADAGEEEVIMVGKRKISVRNDEACPS